MDICSTWHPQAAGGHCGPLLHCLGSSNLWSLCWLYLHAVTNPLKKHFYKSLSVLIGNCWFNLNLLMRKKCKRKGNCEEWKMLSEYNVSLHYALSLLPQKWSVTHRVILVQITIQLADTVASWQVVLIAVHCHNVIAKLRDRFGRLSFFFRGIW